MPRKPKSPAPAQRARGGDAATTRIQVLLTPKAAEQLRRLQRRLDDATAGEVFRRGIKLLADYLEATDAGYVPILRKGDEERPLQAL